MNVMTYTVIYFIGTFVVWEFRNPFQWIIDLPTYENEHRFFIFLSVLIYYGILFAIATGINNKTLK
ncbi:MAG: hypothetical protein JKY53_15125 [Flavobacteriales bacterium]|nr:hypothetical protein [Flavobacteriales bacterium]